MLASPGRVAEVQITGRFGRTAGVLRCCEVRDGERRQGRRGVVSGKLRAQRAKAMKFTDGYMIKTGHSKRAYIDAAVRHVLMRQGVLGQGVGRRLPHDATGKTTPRPLAGRGHYFRTEGGGARAGALPRSPARSRRRRSRRRFGVSRCIPRTWGRRPRRCGVRQCARAYVPDAIKSGFSRLVAQKYSPYLLCFRRCAWFVLSYIGAVHNAASHCSAACRVGRCRPGAHKTQRRTRHKRGRRGRLRESRDRISRAVHPKTGAA